MAAISLVWFQSPDKVIPWTVNEVTDAEALIAIGVDGLITDYPDRIAQLAKQKGIALR